MPVPAYRGKHRHRALFSGSDFVEYLHERFREPRPDLPDRTILLFRHRLRPHVLRKYRARKIPGFDAYGFRVVGQGTGVAFLPSIGAPALATAVEELGAWGVRKFVIVGAAGSLQSDLPAGDLVVCTRALRDEGTSHHYRAPGRYVDPSRSLTRTLERSLDGAGRPYRSGPSWTTDAVYRETVEELVRYRREGILTVEMEAAALFAVTAHHGYDSAALFVISDQLHEHGWRPAFHAVTPQLRGAFAAALGALERPGGRRRRTGVS